MLKVLYLLQHEFKKGLRDNHIISKLIFMLYIIIVFGMSKALK